MMTAFAAAHSLWKGKPTVGYLYETHLHTRQASLCGRSLGRDHVPYYIDRGYTGIVITDHFFHGNTAVEKTLPWKERVELFCSGYEDAREAGEKRGLDVFFGWEENFGDDEYLVYGLDKQFMLDHPEMEFWNRKEQFEAVHQAGGCVIQAHPFRFRAYNHYILLGKEWADGVEVANAGNVQQNDAAAIRYAKEYNLLMTAGSDNHCSPAKTLYGIETEEKLTSIQDYVRMILNHRQMTLHVPTERFEIPETTDLPESWWAGAERGDKYLTGKDWLRDT